MAKYGECEECGVYGIVELHHIISRKQCKPLEFCKHNFVYLCYNHHRHNKTGVHADRKLDHKYKLIFQNFLEIHFLKEYLTREEIKEVLQIKDKPLDILLKPLILQKGKYVREDVIRACMSGKLILEGKE
jgi:hypothetical protein